MHILDSVDAASLKSDIPAFRVGDNVKVHVNIIEGNRSRVQVFQGVVIRRSGESIRETFTVRKVSFQVGVERTFPVHSPVIDKIELVSRGDVRRAKLYYLRDFAARRQRFAKSATTHSFRLNLLLWLISGKARKTLLHQPCLSALRVKSGVA